MLDGDLEAELLEAADKVALSCLPVALLEVGGTQLGVGLLAGQHMVGDMVGDAADAVAHRDDGALAPTFGGEAVILRSEGGGLGLTRPPCRLREQRP
jgi:hypothetical protein